MTYQLAEGTGGDGTGGFLDADRAFATIVGDSLAVRSAVDMARRIAARGAPTVLVSGETGTGKELFARGIHYGGGDPDGPFVAVNCAAIPAQLLESELFGHERGAFTDARAAKRGLLDFAGDGTLFLDEINTLPSELQPKLLRALEERRVRRVGGLQELAIRCRIVAATNQSLEQAVAEGKFREDLFYRLNVLRVEIPPLRDREGDVPLLARHFLAETARKHGLPATRFSAEAEALLGSHGWPGNVRELKNVVERAVLLCEGRVVEPAHLTIHRRENVALGSAEAPHEADSPRGAGAIRIPPGGRSLESIEAEAVDLTLSLTGGNRSAAARILGISRPTLARKIRRYLEAPSKSSGRSRPRPGRGAVSAPPPAP